jgi:hypothetical protein
LFLKFGGESECTLSEVNVWLEQKWSPVAHAMMLRICMDKTHTDIPSGAHLDDFEAYQGACPQVQRLHRAAEGRLAQQVHNLR